MSWFTELRRIVYLRRIAIAQERIAMATEEQSRMMREHWSLQPRPLRPRKTEIAAFDLEAANADWAEQRKMTMQDDEGDET